MGPRRIHLVSLVLLVGAASTWACTRVDSGVVASGDAPSAAPGDEVSRTPRAPDASLTPSPAPSPAPSAPSAEPQPSEPDDSDGSDEPDTPVTLVTLVTLVGDLAVAMADSDGRTTLYHGDVQTSAWAEWAGTDDLMAPLIKAGETLHGIGPDGVADWRTRVKERDGVMLVRRGAVRPPRRTLHLMMKTQRPSPRARLEARALAVPSADVKVLSGWVAREIGQGVVPVGEVRGSFGGDVDRIVVFKPAREFEADDAEPQGEVALLVASGTARGLLPFRAGGITAHLQTGAVFDLDGDGIEEILWLSEELAEDGSGPLLQVSYFAGGEHRVRPVLHRSYSSVREFGGKAGPYSKPEMK